MYTTFRILIMNGSLQFGTYTHTHIYINVFGPKRDEVTGELRKLHNE